MTVEPSPLLVPLVSWIPLGLAIFGAQIFWVAICLRVRGRQIVLPGIALLATDIFLVIVMRACVAAMGRMDYSESFFRWRWFLLALVVAGAGLPVPLWALALRIAHRRQVRGGERTPLIHPVFQASLASWVTAAAIILAAGGSFSFLPRPARITPVEVSVPGLPPQFDGLRIAMLSDHHIGRLMTPQRARKRLESLADARPDLVVSLGDITEEDPRYQPEAAAIIADHKAPLGTYAVAGNFDVRCGTDALREELARVGVVYLENEAACVALNGADLWLVGVGDPWTGEDDLDGALAAVPEGATAVLLSHSPDIVEDAAGRGVPLVLSGHLHGGQIVVPFAGPALGMSRFGTRFAWGSRRVGPTQLIVSRGLGEEALPVRLFCFPEIVLLTLRARP